MFMNDGNFQGQQPQYVPQGTGAWYNGNSNPNISPKQPNNLSQEEIQKLLQKENQFSLQITEMEKLRGICNHRRADGMGDALVEDPVTGVCRCQICGYEFKPIDAQTSQEDLSNSVANVLDILQTIKLLYINMPKEAGREYWQIIPLIEKIPKLFEYAVKDYSKYEQFNPYSYNQRNMNTMNLFNMLAGALNGMPQGQPQQFAGQGFGGPQAQPFYGGMPQGQPQQAPFNPAYANPASNGFGVYGQQPQFNGGYTVQNPGFAYPGNGAMPQGQPQTPPVVDTTAQDVKDPGKVEVNTEFKA
jgi:hypothetical protein